jgi:hypothetical protein
VRVSNRSAPRWNVLRREGKHTEAEQIWAALEALYHEDPAADDVHAEICRARKR